MLHQISWCVVALAVFMKEPVLAKSILAGAVVAILPAVFMTWTVFRHGRGMSPREGVGVVNRGALNKWLLTCLLFAFVFVEAQPLSITGLFAAYVSAMAIQWLLAARYVLRQ